MSGARRAEAAARGRSHGRGRRERRWGTLVLLLVVFAAVGCRNEDEERAALPAPSSSSSSLSLDDGSFVLPPEPPWDPNPLQLPMPPAVSTREDQRIFVVPKAILAQAEPGHALTVKGGYLLRVEGDLYVVRVGTGPSYTVHPAYAIVPQQGRFRRGRNVFAMYNEDLHHGIVTGLRRERIVVKFTDLGFRLGEQRLDPARVGLLDGGLQPGAYAVYATETELRHVLLVSSGQEGGKTLWLTIGFGGRTERIDAERLVPLPSPRFRPRKGDTVRAAWRGSMVVATLRDVERPGLFTVKRARAGSPLLVGPTMLMPVAK